MRPALAKFRRFVRQTAGAAASEFALIAPAFFAIMIGGFALGYAGWTKNILQEASAEAARCIAIGSSVCATVTAGCDSATPGICYTEAMATKRGLSSLIASEVTINPSVVHAGGNFTSVSIVHAYSLVGYTMNLSAQATYPNP